MTDGNPMEQPADDARAQQQPAESRDSLGGHAHHEFTPLPPEWQAMLDDAQQHARAPELGHAQPASHDPAPGSRVAWILTEDEMRALVAPPPSNFWRTVAAASIGAVLGIMLAHVLISAVDEGG